MGVSHFATMNHDHQYEYYLKLRDEDGKPSSAHILSTINLKGLIAKDKWIVMDDNILTNPTIEAVLVLSEPNPNNRNFLGSA